MNSTYPVEARKEMENCYGIHESTVDNMLIGAIGSQESVVVDGNNGLATWQNSIVDGSNYFSMSSVHTSGGSSGYRTRSSSGLASSAKKQHRFRPDAAQCGGEKSLRRRSKLGQLASTSLPQTNCEYVVDESATSSSILLEPCRDRSLVHSTPSWNERDESAAVHAIRSTWRTTVPITPASITDIRLMSPLPAVPASPYDVATEPVDEQQDDDVEMKLVENNGSKNNVVHQVTTPPRGGPLRGGCVPLGRRIAISPICRRNVGNDSGCVTSAESRKLRELSITDLVAVKSEIKPKKLDFSLDGPRTTTESSRSCSTSSISSSSSSSSSGVSSSNFSSDSGIGSSIGSGDSSGYGSISIYGNGENKVDFLSLLGEKSNHLHVVSKILSYLDDEALCKIVKVSDVWRQLCVSDYNANARRKRFLLRKKKTKENVRRKLLKEIQELHDDLPFINLNEWKCERKKGCLIDLNLMNLMNVQPPSRRPPRSPPVSPSKVKFHSFVKASRTLASGEYLLPCPKCRFPCYVNSEKNLGTCSRQSCSIEFCITCSSKAHTGPCKTPLLATPTKQHSKRLIIGSKQSKRNLRRL